MKKIGKILLTLCIILFLFSLYTKKSKNPLVNNFPILLFQIQSGSMIPTITPTEIVLVIKNKDYNTKDIITYQDENGYFITHRIIEKNKEGYITKGDFNNTKDERIVKQEQIKGKVIFHTKWLGRLYKYHYLIIAIIVLLLLFL